MIDFNWTIMFGDQEMTITPEDVVEALGRGIGCMFWGLHNDEKIKGHVQMKIIREIDIQVLERVQSWFSQAIESTRKKTVRMKVVSRKNDKPVEIKGKPGDIVEVSSHERVEYKEEKK